MKCNVAAMGMKSWFYYIANYYATKPINKLQATLFIDTIDGLLYNTIHAYSNFKVSAFWSGMVEELAQALQTPAGTNKAE